MKRIVCVLLFALLLMGCGRIGAEYFDDIKLNSDDGMHTVIICEWGTMGGTGAEIYYENKLIGETSADDAVYPFRDGNYKVEWKKQSIVIIYYSGRDSQTDDPATWEKTEFYFE